MAVNVTNAVGANNTIVLDGSSKIPAYDGSQVTALVATAFTTGTLATARIDVGTTAGKILQLDGSARMPALNATNLVNAPGPTVSTSDPAIDTNSTLGAKWINKTSGEVYICTDATTDENVWTNVGAGSGNVKPWEFGGTQYGFMCSHDNPVSHDINRWSFTSDANATDWGDLAGGVRYSKSGHSDIGNSYGYYSGGYPITSNEIARFSMTSSGGSTDVGDLTQNTSAPASVNNATHCYVLGHEYNGGGGGDGTVVARWAFASSVNASDWSDLMGQQFGGGGATNGAGTYGYHMGGHAPTTDRIQKVNLTSQATATDVANTTQARYKAAGSSSSTHGYNSSGWAGAHSNVIDKFNMSTDADSTDVGNLLTATHNTGGSSSTTYGYTAGGATNLTSIEKHSFTTDGNATDVGDLTTGFQGTAGCQH